MKETLDRFTVEASGVQIAGPASTGFIYARLTGDPLRFALLAVDGTELLVLTEDGAGRLHAEGDPERMTEAAAVFLRAVSAIMRA